MPRQTILALIDFTDVTGPVLTTASDIARAFQAKLILLHVATPEANWEAYVARAFKPKQVLLEVATPVAVWAAEHEGRDTSRKVVATEM